MKVWGRRISPRAPGSQRGWGCGSVRLHVQRLVPDARSRRLVHGVVGACWLGGEDTSFCVFFQKAGANIWPPVHVRLSPSSPYAQTGGIAGGPPSNRKVLASLEMQIPAVFEVKAPTILESQFPAALEIRVPATVKIEVLAN